MADAISVDLPREGDREHLLQALREHGFDARARDGEDRIGVEVVCAEDDSERSCDALVHELEGWLAERRLPFVPEKADGAVYVRPPAG
jgi:ribosomal protein S12 methylthiotransferase accessory factor YcaO